MKSFGDQLRGLGCAFLFGTSEWQRRLATTVGYFERSQMPLVAIRMFTFTVCFSKLYSCTCLGVAYLGRWFFGDQLTNSR